MVSSNILGTDAYRVLRQTESSGILDQSEAWVDARNDRYPPRSNMGNAITYAINQRQALRRFIDDSKLPLDNNFAERGSAPSPLDANISSSRATAREAQNLAVLQSIVATCRLHGVNPYEYIKDLLVRVQTHPAAAIDELLPWNWTPLLAA